MERPAHLSVVLHAHLPFIRHPEHDYHLEEFWFFEALHETYLPLLQMLDRLEADGISGALTLSVSAPLLAMMEDYLLRERFLAYLGRIIELSDRDRRGDDASIQEVADYYHRRLTGLRTYFVDTLQGDLIAALRHHAQTPRLELMTCVGTHPILPFLATPEGRRAQIEVGLDYFEARFGARPRGIWVAECAFEPGVDELLAEAGVAFACLEDRAIDNAASAPVYGTYSPLISEGGVAFFGRDQEASSQVWSADEGYPGDYDYREFYRDRGYDLPLDEVAPYIHPDGIRHDTGLKYHRITGDVALDEKAVYRPDQAAQKAREHARHFLECRIKQAAEAADKMGARPPHITCPYDAELFGHWWFEGPLFLEELFRAAHERDEILLSTPPHFLEAVDVHQQATPATSTWGEDGYFAVWLDESNAEIYGPLRRAERAMVELAGRYEGGDETLRRALRQAARELVLAQSSDWPFIIKTGTTVEYAWSRLTGHLDAFWTLVEMIEAAQVDLDQVTSMEERQTIFAEIDPLLWAAR